MRLKYVVEEFALLMGPHKVQVLDADEETATLKCILPGEADNYTVIIFRFPDVYDIGVASHVAQFRSMDDVPQWFATLLLGMNGRGSLSAWSLLDLDQKRVVLAIRTATVPVNDLSPQRLSATIVDLLREVVSFDLAAIEVAKKHQS